MESVSYSPGGDEVVFYTKPPIAGNTTVHLEIHTTRGERSFSGDLTVRRRYSDTDTSSGISGRMASGEANPLLILIFSSAALLYALHRTLGEKFDGKMAVGRGLAVFLLSYVFLARGVHELLHMATLELLDCPYKLSMNSFIGPNSVSIGSCAISPVSRSVVYTAGIGGTFILGAFLAFAGFKRRKWDKADFAAVTASLLASSTTYFIYTRGDIHALFSTLHFHIPQVYMTAFGLVSTFIVFSGDLYLHLNQKQVR
ncbi:MAG: hypothetical protein SVS85_01940 [Candidatus Nanohaloarchaea archaeon]|nr:hypothetical protein [Candidatus Nanohaloarchaea archaeon]